VTLSCPELKAGGSVRLRPLVAPLSAEAGGVLAAMTYFRGNSALFKVPAAAVDWPQEPGVAAEAYR